MTYSPTGAAWNRYPTENDSLSVGLFEWGNVLRSSQKNTGRVHFELSAFFWSAATATGFRIGMLHLLHQGLALSSGSVNKIETIKHEVLVSG